MVIARAQIYLVMDTVTVKTSMSTATERVQLQQLIIMMKLKPGFVRTPARVGQHHAIKNVIVYLGNLAAMDNVKITTS